MKQWFNIIGLLVLAFAVRAATNAVPPSSALHSGPTSQALASTQSKPASEGIWDSYPQTGTFVMSLARDGAGNVWVGTDGNGIWRFNPLTSTNKQWTQFTVTNGLGDDYCYSLAVDKQGRVWAGHLNHGVSVFNGTTWSNYDVPNGPIGERIFKIAVCPTDGDVWLATSAGLTRYEVKKDTWTQYTRGNTGSHLTPTLSPGSGGEGEGLPSDQINTLAFDAQGNLYVGTQCDGIAMAKAATDYKKWTRATVVDADSTVQAGYGLPSPLINDLLVAADGTVYAATCGGLACSFDGGATWQFHRGEDFPKKVRERASERASIVAPKDALPEDYVTCLAEDDAGVIWLGFRQSGLMAMDGNSHLKRLALSPRQMEGADSARAILTMSDYQPWLASYGGGLLWANEPVRLSRNAITKRSFGIPEPTAETPFPTPARKPDVAELNTLLKEIAAVPVVAKTNAPVVTPLEDDWRTEGQWLGRYGRFWMVLCADRAPGSDVWGAGWDVQYDARIGPNHKPGDALRSWIHWLATKDNRCLEMTPIYLHSRVVKKLTTWDADRRESEWDDHGEAYPMTKDGPHVYCSMSIPAGLFYLSMYEVNPNGHTTGNRFRDYQISVRPHPGRESLDQYLPGKTVIRSFYDLEEFELKPELAHARACDFWNGVYKRFLVRGPTKLTIQLNRNHSFNTILPAVMLDLVDELPPPYFQTRAAWEQQQTQTLTATNFQPAVTATEAAQRLLGELQQLPGRNELWWAQNKRRCYLPLLRWYQQSGEQNPEALATCYYQLGLYPQWEEQLKAAGIVSAREIEKAQRWDGVLYSSVGKGNEFITKYVAAHPPRINKQTAANK